MMAEAQTPPSPSPSPPKKDNNIPRSIRNHSHGTTRTTDLADDPMADVHVVPPNRAPTNRIRKTSIVDDESMPDATPLETSPTTSGHPKYAKKPPYATAGQSVRGPSASSESAVMEFLAGCYPPMSHLAPALIRAGVEDIPQLNAVRDWDQEQLRKFLSRNQVAHTPREVEAIVVGLSVRRLFLRRQMLIESRPAVLKTVQH
jgi:hypothetical protein